MKNLFALGRLFKNGQNKASEPEISIDQVKMLVEQIKEFNAGVIDHILTKHCDNVYEKWLKEIKGE